MHLLIFHGSGERGIVNPFPVAEVKIFVDGLIELALSKLFSILSQLFVVKIFGKILRKVDNGFLG